MAVSSGWEQGKSIFVTTGIICNPNTRIWVCLFTDLGLFFYGLGFVFLDICYVRTRYEFVDTKKNRILYDRIIQKKDIV